MPQTLTSSLRAGKKVWISGFTKEIKSLQIRPQDDVTMELNPVGKCITFYTHEQAYSNTCGVMDLASLGNMTVKYGAPKHISVE